MAQNDLATTSLPPATSQPVKPRRGRKPGQPARQRADLPADAFRIESVPEDERGNVRRIRVERTKQQQAIDAKVLEVWREWRDAGGPVKWLEMPVKTWLIESRFKEDALFFLGKAAQLHGKKLVVGDVKPAHDNPGKVRIPFCVISRKKSDEEETSTAVVSEDTPAASK